MQLMDQYGFVIPGNPYGPHVLGNLRSTHRMGRDVIRNAAQRLAQKGPAASLPADFLDLMQGANWGTAAGPAAAQAGAALQSMLSAEACTARLRAAAADLQRACGWR